MTREARKADIAPSEALDLDALAQIARSAHRA